MSARLASSASMSVGILGAGPAGLSAGAAALEEGLRPVIFEAAEDVGGLWREHGKVWRSLRTNLSKYTCSFSDFPWPKAAPDFPSAHAMRNYLHRYAEAKGLLPLVRTSSEVQEVVSLGPGWQVTVESAGEVTRESFDFLVVATGIFSTPASVPGVEDFAGHVSHAADYRDPESFQGLRVLVVGAAFSGADIATELGGSAASVTIATSTPFWYLPRYIRDKPADLLFYSRAAHSRNAQVPPEELRKRRHGFFQSLVGEMPANLTAPSHDRGDIPAVAISDEFLSAVRSGRVEVRGRVVQAEGNRVSFEDGCAEFDHILLATGYRLEMPFLSSDLQDQLQLDPSDQLQPLLLAHQVWPVKAKNLAFVGLYRGPYFAAIELMSRWACGVFSGRLPPLSEEQLQEALHHELQIRQQVPRPQFPHDYVEMAERLSGFAQVRPTEILEDVSHPLHRALIEGPLLPCHYRLQGFKAVPEMAASALAECLEAYPL
ncbi:unnamed protein product [Effrenium voratum]|uniref:Flavin-containing monooxygenase n=1 Tax=Effrenium voratum TaxID=2562239 RepID=A0AA36JS34_9DINO|nr:unnamed protein product [Effrenium voratum]